MLTPTAALDLQISALHSYPTTRTKASTNAKRCYGYALQIIDYKTPHRRFSHMLRGRANRGRFRQHSVSSPEDLPQSPCPPVIRNNIFGIAILDVQQQGIHIGRDTSSKGSGYLPDSKHRRKSTLFLIDPASATSFSKTLEN